MDSEKKQTAQVASRARKITTLFTIVFFAIGIVCLAVAAWLLLGHHFPNR
jgi:type VI protein secretion system component VasF